MFKKIFSIEKKEPTYRNRASHIEINILGLKLKFKTKNKEKVFKKNNCIALINAGGIGDYMMVRQYFKYFQLSEKYKNKNLIYFCTKNYADFAKVYDSDVLDEVIVCNENQIGLCKNIKQILKNYTFDEVVSLQCLQIANKYKGRKVMYKLIKLIKAKSKVADVILEDKNDKIVKNKNLKIFNKIIYSKPNDFEFERRRKFFEQLLNIKIPQEEFNINPFFNPKEKYIAMSIMAMSEARNYNKEGWIKIINHILSTTNYKIFFIGGKIDSKNINATINCAKDKQRCVNLSGLTDASLIPVILKNAQLLISPETGTVHIAQAVKCKTVCLCGGNHYNRFLPHKDIIYIFPDEFDEILSKGDEKTIAKYYFAKPDNKIYDIKTDKVIKVLDKVLSSH